MKRVIARAAGAAVIALLAAPIAALAQDGAEAAATHVFTAADAVEFNPIEVPGFDSGMRIAVVHGDPGSEGDYTIRLSFPDGYRFPAHYHPKAEHVTVLEGTFLLAMGTSHDPAAIERYAPGAFLYIAPEHPHYGGAEGATTIQLHGEGPFDILLSDTEG